MEATMSQRPNGSWGLCSEPDPPPRGVAYQGPGVLHLQARQLPTRNQGFELGHPLLDLLPWGFLKPTGGEEQAAHILGIPIGKTQRGLHGSMVSLAFHDRLPDDHLLRQTLRECQRGTFERLVVSLVVREALPLLIGG